MADPFWFYIFRYHNNCIGAKEKIRAISGLIKSYDFKFLSHFNPKVTSNTGNETTENDTDIESDVEEKSKKHEKPTVEIAGEYETWSIPLSKYRYKKARRLYVKYDYPFPRNDEIRKGRAWKWTQPQVDAMFDFLTSSGFYQDVAFNEFHDKKIGLSMPAVIRNRKRAEFVRQFRQYCVEKQITPIPSSRYVFKLLVSTTYKDQSITEPNLTRRLGIIPFGSLGSRNTELNIWDFFLKFFLSF